MEQNQNVNDCLAQLDDAKNLRVDWRDIAQLLDEVQTHGRWRQHYESSTSWMNTVSEKSKYSVGMLQRMLATRRFLSKMAKENPKKYTALLSANDVPKLPLAAVEIVKRIFDINPEKGRDLLDKVAKDEASYTTVRSEYNAIIQNSGASDGGSRSMFVSAGKMGLRHARQFSKDAYNVVVRYLPELIGVDDATPYFRKYKFEYVTLDAVALRRKGGQIEFVDGFDFRFLRPAMIRARRKQTLAEIVFAASFFRSYWLFVPELSKLVESMVDDLHKLGVTSIGVAVVTTGDVENLEIVLEPQHSEFSERQEYIFKEIMDKGLAIN